MFEKKKKRIKFSILFTFLSICGFLFVSYIYLFHNPKLELLSSKTISYSGFKAQVFSRSSKIDFIEIYLSKDGAQLFKIYEYTVLDKAKDKHSISVTFDSDDEIINLIKKNKLESLYLHYSIKYKNKLFSSTIKKKININIDFIPPIISDIETDGYVYIGGIGYMLYKTSLDTYSSYVETGIDIETGKVRRFFPISIKKENKINNLVFFSCGNMRCKDNAVLIKAEDASGNVVTYKKRIRTIINKTWNKSSINIDLNFFKNKYNEIYSTNLKSINTTHFLELNSKLRKANNLLIYNQTKKVTRDLLFNSFFSQMKDSKVFSRYSDFREYVEAENEKSLMSVYHWGYDLSSIKNALVYASSPGLITYVDQEGLGIYGKTIIINHGAGFYSIYSHLSEINVEENQKVDKTSVIAKSGETGLAFGDHLHYGTYLQGIPFDSNEMWDKKYIKQKVITIYNNFFKEDVK
mgnify:FL=1